MGVGNRIYLRRKLPDKEVVEGFRELPAANVADVMGRSPAMNLRIRLISHPDRPVMVGTALTVKARAGDNLLLHKALDMAQEGDVIVVSNEEDNTRSLMGEIMMIYLANTRKAEGIVLDGPIRDVDVIREMTFPVYATGSTPNGPYKEGPGEINVPIACGGVQVDPGDIILGDTDGVIVIPRVDARNILKQAQKYHALDDQKCQAAREGTSNRSWVDKSIQSKGVEIIDDYYCR